MTKNLMPSSSRAIEATKWADRSHKPSVRDRVGGLPTTGGSDTCGMPHFPHAALNLYHLYRYTPLVEKSASKTTPLFFWICSVSFCQSSHLKSFRIRRFDCNLQNSQMLWKPLTLKLFRERSTYHKTGWVGSSRHQQKIRGSKQRSSAVGRLCMLTTSIDSRKSHLIKVVFFGKSWWLQEKHQLNTQEISKNQPENQQPIQALKTSARSLWGESSQICTFYVIVL